MAWKIGDEFNEFRGAYVPAKRGEGTHVWNGSKIVPKPKKRKEKKNDERATYSKLRKERLNNECK